MEKSIKIIKKPGEGVSRKEIDSLKKEIESLKKEIKKNTQRTRYLDLHISRGWYAARKLDESLVEVLLTNGEKLIGRINYIDQYEIVIATPSGEEILLMKHSIITMKKTNQQ